MYKQYQNFGEFVQEKREEKQITLRKFADTIGFSAPFWSDVEKDRRNPPEIDKLHLIAQTLNLTESENAIMLDLAGKKRNSVAPDLPDYNMERGYVAAALRTARDLDAGEKEWNEFIEELRKRKG